MIGCSYVFIIFKSFEDYSVTWITFIFAAISVAVILKIYVLSSTGNAVNSLRYIIYLIS